MRQGYQDGNALAASRRAALLLVVGFGVLAGLGALAQLFANPVPSWLSTAANGIDVVLVIGAVVVGALFGVHLVKGRKA